MTIKTIRKSKQAKHFQRMTQWRTQERLGTLLIEIKPCILYREMLEVFNFTTYNASSSFNWQEILKIAFKQYNAMMIPDIFSCYLPLENAEVDQHPPKIVDSESRKISELVFTISDTQNCLPNVYKPTPIHHCNVRVAMTILTETTSENKTYDRRLAFRSTVRCW